MTADMIAQLKYIVQTSRARGDVCHEDYLDIIIALTNFAAAEGILVEVRAAEEALCGGIRSQQPPGYGVDGGPKSKFGFKL